MSDTPPVGPQESSQPTVGGGAHRSEHLRSHEQADDDCESRFAARTVELQSALRENRRLVTAINSAATGVILSDPTQPDAPIIFVNQAFCTITGYLREEILGRNCRFLQGKDTDPAMVAQIRAALAEQRPFRGTLLNYRKDGTPFWNGLTINPVFDDPGGLVNFVGVQIDLTARVEELEQVRRSAAQLVLAQRVARLGSWGQTFTHGSDPMAENLTWSDETFRIFGHAPGTADNARSLFESGVHPQDRTAVHAAYAEALRARQAHSIDYRIVRPDGTERVVHEEADLIFDATGRLQQVVGIVQDITERRQADVARTRLAAIVDSSADAIVGEDLQGIVTSWNAGAERIFGYSAQEMVGRTILLLIPPGREGEEEVFLARTRLGERAADIETIRLTKVGRMIDVSVGVSPIRDAAGVVVGLSKITRDITERKQAEESQRAKEEAERANLAKSEFLSRMSHELRTPLNSILGFSQLLESSELNEQDAQGVQFILKGGRHLLALVDEVLDLARVEAGELLLTNSLLTFDQVARQAMGLIARMAQARGITCAVEASPAAQVPILADEQRLRQVLLNLLSNAVKYNREGGHVALSCEQVPNVRIRMSVRDTGPGMSPESLTRLFVPFERLGQEFGEVEGTGLGLAVSRRFVEAMGGSLGVASQMGQGSVFWIELPAAISAAAAEILDTKLTAQAVAAPDEFPWATLLYIEDNPSNLQVVQMVMDRMRPHWRFLPARDGESGLRQARKCSPDVILLDLQLPGMKGDEVLMQLRADPDTRCIPVLLLSADATARTSERLLALGANDYLPKPFSIAALLNKLDALLRSRREHLRQ